ncbi:NAD-dependent epimerase [Agarilytica rhodophyticola]|uniref:NAD-dependent epimerase n=1 Tax=Agarilytica rhodophyticola TaxID=1737490 RepID=UPI000B348BC8|nr:NAD-dependent epimerase [Agarilytica rhodophyticola]
MKYLVTGAAGFIGFHVSKRLLDDGHYVVGVDNLNSYYDVSLKKSRLVILSDRSSFRFFTTDLADEVSVASLFSSEKFDRVIHLAAQAGVRYSIDNPMAYAQSNLLGHMTVLEGCRNNSIEHLVYASSSSVYGINNEPPFLESIGSNHPISVYAATKRANELISHSYSHLYDLPTTGLRFFTVYGPWGRPDMALFKFAKNIFEGEHINVYNNGELYRDFTYIDDIVEGIIRIQGVIPESKSSFNVECSDPSTSWCNYRLYNIGNGKPVNLMRFIEELEKCIGIKAKKRFLKMQSGDVYTTHADTDNLFQATGYRPRISIGEGVKRFVEWYKDFYDV